MSTSVFWLIATRTAEIHGQYRDCAYMPGRVISSVVGILTRQHVHMATHQQQDAANFDDYFADLAWTLED